MWALLKIVKIKSVSSPVNEVNGMGIFEKEKVPVVLSETRAAALYVVQC